VRLSRPTLFALIASVVLRVATPPLVLSTESVPQAVAHGKRVFNQACAPCHDLAGKTAKPGPELKNYYHRQPLPADAAVRAIIQQGKGRMPALGSLNKLQVDDVVAYLKTL
jgi:mono/diheme cytochrome c family protein